MSKMITVEISEEELAAVQVLLGKLHEMVSADAKQERAERKEIDRLKAESRRMDAEIHQIAERTQITMQELEVTAREMFPEFRGINV